MDLGHLKPAKGSTKNKKRRGRGEGSGSGVTAGRGHKGYHSRGGSKHRAWFEGGQMPIQRRLPKFGFNPINKIIYQVVNLKNLISFTDTAVIDSKVLFEKGLVRNERQPVKILGDGEISVKLNIQVHAVSKSAQEKIERAGGTVTLL